MFLHIILLEKDKLFLHVSTHDKVDMHIVLTECELINEYLSKYKPIRIIETISICQDDEINYFVKKYMKYYGIDNVRGGSYSNELLTVDERKFITEETNQILNVKKLQCNLIEDILTKYTEIDNWSNDKIYKILLECKKQQEKYNNEKQMLHNFTVGIDNTLITRVILADLKWILNHCGKTIKLEGTYTTTDEIIEKYKEIVMKIKSMYIIFTKYLDERNTYEPEIYLSNPELLLDQYFYQSNIEYCINKYDSVCKYIEMCEFMTYCIICKIQGYEFDVKSYPNNFEMSNTYEIKFLENHLNECLSKSGDISHQS